MGPPNRKKIRVFKCAGIDRRQVFSADAKKLIALNRHGKGLVWDFVTTKVLATFAVDYPEVDVVSRSVRCVAFSPKGPKGPLLAVNRELEATTFLETKHWKKVGRLDDAGRGVSKLCFSPDEILVATVDAHIRLWDVQTGKELVDLGDWAYSIAYHPMGKHSRRATGRESSFGRSPNFSKNLSVFEAARIEKPNSITTLPPFDAGRLSANSLRQRVRGRSALKKWVCGPGASAGRRLACARRKRAMTETHYFAMGSEQGSESIRRTGGVWGLAGGRRGELQIEARRRQMRNVAGCACEVARRA
jgi:WD40 repeat protein